MRLQIQTKIILHWRYTKNDVFWRSRWYVTGDRCDVCITRVMFVLHYYICNVCITGILRTMFSGGVGGISLWIDVMFVLHVVMFVLQVY